MRIHVILIFVISFGALLGVTVLRTEQNLLGERNIGINGLVDGQNSGLVPAVDSEVKSLSHDLSLGFQILNSEKAQSYGLGKPYSRFLMISKVNPLENGDWEISDAVFREGTAVKPWANAYVTLALKSVASGKVIRGGVLFFTLLDPHRTAHLMMLFRTGQNEWFVGVLGSETFQALMDRQKGLGTESFLVNSQGQIVAHGTPEYIGTLLGDDPLVAEIIKSGKVRGGQEFSRSKKDYKGTYEQVPTTNLYLVVTAPLAPATAFRNSVITPLVVLGVGIFVVAVALLLLMDRPNHIPMPASRRTGMNPSAGGYGSVGLNSVTPAAAVPSAKNVFVAADGGPAPEKMEAFKTSAGTLAQEMKNPLLGVLAQIQSLKSSHPELSEELGSIESLAREGRGVLQKIFSFAGENIDTKLEDVRPEEVVMAAVQKVQPLLTKKGVQIEKDFRPSPAIKGSSAALQKAFAQIITNAVDAMERAASKKLRIEISENGGDVEIRFVDTGEGISIDDRNKIFDPFFTTRKSRGHLGLGLTSAYAICKEFGGIVVVENSELKKGTTVLARFSPQSASNARVPTALKSLGANSTSPAPTFTTPASSPAPQLNSQNQMHATPAATPKINSTAKPVSKVLPTDAVEKTIQMLDELEPLAEPFRGSAGNQPPPAPDLDDLGELKLDLEPTVTEVAPKTATVTSPPKPNLKPNVKLDLPKKGVDQMKVSIRKPGAK